MTNKRLFKTSLFLWLVASLLCFAVFKTVDASQDFCGDLGTTPYKYTGFFPVEDAGCFLSAWGMKALFDETPEGKKIDWVPVVAITLASALIHIPFWNNGGQDAWKATNEQFQESGAAFLAIVLPI